MTAPTLVSVTDFGDDVGNTLAVYTYPSTDAGDLLIIVHAMDASAGDKPTLPAPFTTLLSSGPDDHTFAVGIGIAYLICDGTESGNFNVTHPSTESWSGRIIRISGWHGTTAPEVGSLVGAVIDDDTSAISVSPSGWDSSADDTMWIWFHSSDRGATTILTFPPELPDNNTQYSAGTLSPNNALAFESATKSATFNVAAQTNNISAAIAHGEILIGVRGLTASRTPTFSMEITHRNFGKQRTRRGFR